MLHRFVMVAVASLMLLMTGCSEEPEQPKQQTNEPMQSANGDQQNMNNTNQNNSTPNTNNQSNDLGKEQQVGRFKVRVNSVQVVSGGEVSQPKNGQYLVVDARVENTGDIALSLTGKAFLTNASGQRVEAQYSPVDVKDLNYVTTTVAPRSYYTHGVLVFDIAPNPPYTLEIEDEDQKASWTLQQ